VGRNATVKRHDMTRNIIYICSTNYAHRHHLTRGIFILHERAFLLALVRRVSYPRIMTTNNTATTTQAESFRPGYKYADGRYNGKCKYCGTKASFLNIGITTSAGKWQGEGRPTGTIDTAHDADGRTAEYGNGEIFLSHSCSVSQYVTTIRLRRVLGKYNPGKECNALCMSATGHSCECSCGGRNHGAAHAA
jgi:hypothetical protein